MYAPAKFRANRENASVSECTTKKAAEASAVSRARGRHKEDCGSTDVSLYVQRSAAKWRDARGGRIFRRPINPFAVFEQAVRRLEE